jgi:hypothetical protein
VDGKADYGALDALAAQRINMLGSYAFVLPDQIAHGELRPLCDPANANDEG